MMLYKDLYYLNSLLTRASWTYAKTMPQAPHHYTLRKTWNNQELFNYAVYTIQQHGYVEKYKGRNYTMLNINGNKYWTMGAPVDSTILINRAVVQYNTEYDSIAHTYDSLFDNEESIREDKEVLAMIPDSDNVLDVGCGTGLYLQYRQPKHYLGIDMSRNMLAVLHTHHAGYKTTCTKFEEFCGEKYDLIVSLFGSPSYIDPYTLNDRIPELLAPGGKYFMMFFAPSYYPLTHKMTNIHTPYYSEPLLDQLELFTTGQEIHHGNFTIRTNA